MKAILWRKKDWGCYQRGILFGEDAGLLCIEDSEYANMEHWYHPEEIEWKISDNPLKGRSDG
ncbi:hypothetical protein CCP3SC15_150031 [Gammaproteobacteria bacterium]